MRKLLITTASASAALRDICAWQTVELTTTVGNSPSVCAVRNLWLADVKLPGDAWLRVADNALTGSWRCCADPVFLRATMDNVQIASTPHLALAAEVAGLEAMMATTFPEHGFQFHIEATGQTTLSADQALTADRSAPAGLLGQTLREHLAANAISASLATRETELQMLLAESEINRSREAQGRLPVTALWFWGGTVAGDAVPQYQLPLLVGRNSCLAGWWSSSTTSQPSSHTIADVLAGDDDAVLDFCDSSVESSVLAWLPERRRRDHVYLQTGAGLWRAPTRSWWPWR